MLQEIMASIEEPKKPPTMDQVGTFETEVPELHLGLKTEYDLDIVKLSVAGEAAENTALSLESLAALAGEGLTDQSLEQLVEMANRSLTTVGEPEIIEKDAPKRSIGEKAKLLWAKIKVIVSKLLIKGKKAIKALFSNLDKIEAAYKKSLKFVLNTELKAPKKGEIRVTNLEPLYTVKRGKILEAHSINTLLTEILVIPKALSKIGSEFSVTGDEINLPSTKSIADIFSAKLTGAERANLEIAEDDMAWSPPLPGIRRVGYEAKEKDGKVSGMKLFLRQIYKMPAYDTVTYSPGDIIGMATGRLKAGVDLVGLVRAFDNQADKLTGTLDGLIKTLDKNDNVSTTEIAIARNCISSIINVISKISSLLVSTLKANYNVARGGLKLAAN